MTTTSAPTALITGASKRIGRAIALGLAQDGFNIGLHYHSSEQDARTLADELSSKWGAQTALLPADLSAAQSVEKLVQNCQDQLGTITALINNASVFERDTVETLNDASWAMHLDTNLKAPALLMRDFAEQAPTGSVIINIIDQRVWRLNPDFISYTVSKVGLWGLTQTFAQALAARHIRVNAIGPGPTLPNPRQSRADFEEQATRVPLGHGAEPDDIVAAVRYIFGAKAMTGQMIALDGGQHLAWETPDIVGINE